MLFFYFFYLLIHILRQVPTYFICLGGCCKAVLRSSSINFPSAWGWVDDDWIFIRWSYCDSPQPPHFLLGPSFLIRSGSRKCASNYHLWLQLYKQVDLIFPLSTWTYGMLELGFPCVNFFLCATLDSKRGNTADATDIQTLHCYWLICLFSQKSCILFREAMFWDLQNHFICCILVVFISQYSIQQLREWKTSSS